MKIPTATIEIEGRRKIVNADDPRVAEYGVDPASEEITPEGIDKMKKADLIDLLKAHGVEEPAGNVAELRDALRAVMFVQTEE
jgi:hypothetical protein